MASIFLPQPLLHPKRFSSKGDRTGQDIFGSEIHLGGRKENLDAFLLSNPRAEKGPQSPYSPIFLQVSDAQGVSGRNRRWETREAGFSKSKGTRQPHHSTPGLPSPSYPLLGLPHRPTASRHFLCRLRRAPWHRSLHTQSLTHT